MDGAKMLALAAMALAGVALARRGGPLPRWLGYVAAALTAAMIASGVGYLLLSNTLAQAAAVSLPLLLIWVVAWRLAAEAPSYLRAQTTQAATMKTAVMPPRITQFTQIPFEKVSPYWASNGGPRFDPPSPSTRSSSSSWPMPSNAQRSAMP